MARIDRVGDYQLMTSNFRMVAIKKKGVLWYLFRVPLYLYRWRLGRIFGKFVGLNRRRGCQWAATQSTS